MTVIGKKRERQSILTLGRLACQQTIRANARGVVGESSGESGAGGDFEGSWMAASYLLIKLGNAVCFAHERVLVPSMQFRLVTVKLVALDRCKRGITIWWHNRFWENPMSLGARVADVRVPVIICRTDGADNRVVSVPKSVFVFLLACGAPDGIKNVLALWRGLRSEVRPNGATMGPHYRLVVLGAPLGRGR